MTHRPNPEKDAASEGAGSPDPPPSPDTQSPFERFEEFARRVVSVPKTELDRREKAYRDKRRKI